MKPSKSESKPKTPPVRSGELRKRQKSSSCTETVSVYSAVEAMRAHLPDLGRRPLTLDEFYQLAERLEIRVVEELTETGGICCALRGRLHIFIDPELPEPMKTFVAYHEIAHAILHVADFAKLETKAERTRATSQTEREADLIGALAILPITGAAIL